jgi:ribosomal protein L7/L12
MGETYDGYALQARVAELERKVDYLMQRIGSGEMTPSVPTLGPASPVPPDIVELARSGHKIEAIKRYREATGVGLREAKDAIDQLG